MSIGSRIFKHGINVMNTCRTFFGFRRVCLKLAHVFSNLLSYSILVTGITSITVTLSNVAQGASKCAQVLSHPEPMQITISPEVLQAKIENLTTLKILWDIHKTASLSPAEIAVANYYPKRAQELLHATGMTYEQLNELLKQETLKRQGHESRTTQLEEEKRAKELDTITITDPNFLTEYLVFHEVKPGEFLMGDSDKQVKTEITKPFAMMATQVTQQMWAKLNIALDERDLNKLNPAYFKTGTESRKVNIKGIELQMKTDHPVEQVSYTEVNKFIEGLNKISATGDTKSQELLEQIILGHKKGDVYDLPTEAQWEFVMRDRGNANKKYFDQDDESRLKNFAWFNENSGDQTHAVASLQPRMVDGLPFYDLEGNVWEWSKDWYMDKLKGGKDPETSAGYVLGVRGGSWSYGAACARPGYRGYYHADSRLAHVGFRLIRTRP